MSPDQIRQSYIRQQKKRILDAHGVTIDCDVPLPIAVDDRHETLPYVTIAEIRFNVAGREVRVPHNFRFDGASIPLIVFVLRALAAVVLCRWLFNKWSARSVMSFLRPLNTTYRNLLAACLHDYCYTEKPRGLPRALADVAFEAVLVAEGEYWLTARVMRYAVEMFGGPHWDSKK